MRMSDCSSDVCSSVLSGVKVAGFVGLIRVFHLGFSSFALDWQPLIYALAAITVLVGAVLAVVQTDVKRMLAYSSISHAGFILVAVQPATDEGVQAPLFYLAAYIFQVGGTFAVIALVGRDRKSTRLNSSHKCATRLQSTA